MSHLPVQFLLASSPHADTFGYSMPPPGLLRLGGELERRGFDVGLEDLAFRQAAGDLGPAEDDGLCDRAAERLLARGEARVLGLSVMGATLPAALAIAARYRAARPGVPVLLGGPGTTGVDAALLERFPQVDAVVRGEGEVTTPEVLTRWLDGRDLRGVAGTTWRGPDGAPVREPERPQLRDLDDLAEYAWHLLPPLTDYKAITGEAEGLTPLDSGRGCAYDCSFCTIGRYWGRRTRPLPAARLAREVLALREHPGARHAYLCHDLFGADRAHALEFCRLLTEAEAPVPWEARARIDHLDPELLRAMRAAGGYRVLVGIESADPEVRRANQKGMRDDVDLLGVIDACAAAGVIPILSLILGLPGEDDAALARSLDLCADASLRAGVNLSLHLVNPQPGCGLGERHAGETRAVDGIPPDMAFGCGATAPERALIDAHPDLFSTFHLLPLGDERLTWLARIARELPEVLMRYPRTFALLRRRRVADALELFTAWKAHGRSFEAFALAAEDPLVEDALAWEQARVRAGARGPLPAGAPDPEAVPRPAGELLPVRHDLARMTPDLLDVPAGEHLLFVQATPGALAGTRTLRVGPDVARVLQRLDGRTTLRGLEHRLPGIGGALERLHGAGLVRFQAP